ncbi:hypothetical protein ACH5RR_001024 [Cinchona calisaya]|uniref:Uncharacterized protein n=1 Tax=Cinchona calisaya TaxID=153742 RepID=A0ABD3B2W8_9GENT
MMDAETETSSEIVSERRSSLDDVASVAKYSESSIGEAFTEFTQFMEKLSPLLDELKANKRLDKDAIYKAIESLETEFYRAKHLLSSVNVQSSPLKHIEDVTQNLGRSLGLVLFASHEVSMANKEKIEALRMEMMNNRLDLSSERESEFARDVSTDQDLESEEEILEEDRITLDIKDVVFQLSCGSEEEFKRALVDLDALLRENMITDQTVDEEGIISILCNRLNSSKSNNRLAIIQILRCLNRKNDKNKEKMEEVEFLSLLVKSLARDAEERREAVALLSNLSDVAAVRRRIGRIQGCIVMLVSIFNGEDQEASDDAGRLLNALSNNTQNVLNMAEAGCFKPLIQYLREGSDMSKILMATTLSRMELSDQSKASLGEYGAIEPLVNMFNRGNLEAKLSALSALQNLSSLKENIQRLVSSGIVVPLLQLLFSVTSVLMTLREPASAILAMIAQSESILVKSNVAQQMLSLLNLCSPVIQCHLLHALNSIAAHTSAVKVRRKMKENGAIQLLLPFLVDGNSKSRTAVLHLIYTLSMDDQQDLTQQLGEMNIGKIASIISSSTSESEKAAAVGILSNLPVSDRKVTDILRNANTLPTLVSILSSLTATSTPTAMWLAESIAGLLIRYTIPSDKKLQLFSVNEGVISVLLKLLLNGSAMAKSRAATCLAQLSQNSLSLKKSRKSSWFCSPPSVDGFCEVHDGYCSVKSTFCLIKADAVSHLIRVLQGTEREADEAVLSSLETLLQDDIWENGSNHIAKCSGIPAIIKVLECGSIKAQEKALWILERIFRIESLRIQHSESAQVVLIDLAQNGDPKLKPAIAKLLAQLELLQVQSSYF